jgi:hypothetical protein
MNKYFVCYWSWDPMGGGWSPNNIIINEHPIQWLKNRFPDRNSKYINDYPIKLGFWQELKREDVK